MKRIIKKIKENCTKYMQKKIRPSQGRMSFVSHSMDYKISALFDKYGEKILFSLAIFISTLSFLYFYHTHQILADYDAIARLNIARKMLDSITPGIGQLGGVWLPFPQVLMMPFILNNFMWHSGIAGSIVSMTVFIISTIFLFKTSLLITKKRIASLIVWFVYITNMNLLLLQTMAMSESFFLFSMIMTIYFLTRWSVKRTLLSLLYAAFFIILITLTRYEGYFIFIGGFITVITILLIEYLKDRNIKKVEGTVLLFGTLASYGILLWCLYCALFYKDPLYWLHLYSGSKGQIAGAISSAPQQGFVPNPKTIYYSFLTYFETMLWMNGILNSFLAIAGLVTLIISIIINILKKTNYMQYVPVALNGIILFGFLVYGYQRDLIPSIEYPLITSVSLLHKSFNFVAHSNIRYGTVMAPFIALYIGYFASKKRIVTLIAICIIGLQLYTNFYTSYFLFFQLPKAWTYVVPENVYWFKNNYDHGLILISANRHEKFMFQTGLSYNHFIYEGARNYWTTSLNDPEKYASWVIFDHNLEGDAVSDFITKDARGQLATDFTLEYTSGGLSFYHLKQKAKVTSHNPVPSIIPSAKATGSAILSLPKRSKQ